MISKQQFFSRLSALREDYAPYRVREAYTSLLVVSLVLVLALMAYGVYVHTMAAMVGIFLGCSSVIILRIYRAAYTVINYLLKGD